MYEIYSIPDGSAQLLEQLGNKFKFWFRKDGRKWMFKEGRTNTGEDWAEKVVSEICQLLNVPCAVYHFSKYMGKSGVISESVVPDDGMLTLGNELLARLEKEYDAYNRGYHHADYTVRRALAVLRSKDILIPFNWSPPVGITSAPDVFVGYLMIDALVGNQDRHHENWGLVALSNKNRHLAPTFDHASSLGRNESDERRLKILDTKDRRCHITNYITKAKSAFFSAHTRKRLSTIQAFQEAKRYHPEAAKIWLQQLARLTSDEVNSIVAKVPDDIMSPVARRFACTMVSLNQQRLLQEVEV